MIDWLILIFLPRRWPLLIAVPRYTTPFGLSLFYAGLAMGYFSSVEDGGYGSLDQVAALLGKREMLLAGWIDYLAFDLFIGGWIAVEADRVGINRVIQAPLLIATFMFGSMVLAILLTIRTGYFRKKMAPDVAVSAITA